MIQCGVMKGKGRIGSTAVADKVVKAAATIRRAAFNYSSRVWALVSVSNLTQAFAREMVSSNDANMQATESVDDGLLQVGEGTREIVSEISAAVGEISGATEPFQAVSDTIGNFTDALVEMDQRFQEVGAAFGQVNTAAQGISETVAEIRSISSLTNLLALNATLEAARAGRHGRSFRVVASEVKKLAGQTSDLTKSITELLEDLTTSVRQTTSSLGLFAEVRDEITRKATEARENLSESDSALQLTSSRMTRVMTSVNQQQDRVQEMVEQMGALRASVSNVTSSSRHIMDNLVSEADIVEAIGGDDTELRDGAQGLSDVLRDTGLARGAKDQIVVGHDLAYPPWCYVENGVSAGLSIDVMKLIADTLGLSISFQPKQFTDVLRDFKSGRTRIILNVGWPNPLVEDAGAIPSKPYAVFEPVIFVPRGDDDAVSRDPSEFHGQNLAFQMGSYTEYSMKEHGANMVPVENDIQGIASLIWRKVDGVVTERLVGGHISRRFFHGEIVVGSSACERVDVVMALREKDAGLRRRMNSLLAKPAFQARVRKILQSE